MSIETKTWTVKAVLDWSTKFLKEKGFVAAKTDAELLLMAALNCERLELYTKFDRPLSPEERQKYREFILRRAKQEPVQYIAGFTYFMGLKFQVDPRVLIPRFDTEILVETVIDALKEKSKTEKVTIVDVGTGSGAIAIALAKYLPQTEFLALDISDAALELAKTNAQTNGVAERIIFRKSDILEEAIHGDIKDKVVIVANPPYVGVSDYNMLAAEIRNWEPASALKTGPDDLIFYRRIIDQATFFGDNLQGLFFEVGYNQAERLTKILTEKYLQEPLVKNDLGGIARVVYNLF